MRLDRSMVFLTSFAESNQTKSESLQQKIENDVDSESTSDGKPLSLYIMGEFCVMLPPVHEYPVQFTELIFDALIDGCMRTELENAKVINWCTAIKPMYPLNTKSDGNCLLHAVSMAMWGIEDTHLVLRRLLHQSLLDDNGQFRKRWLLENKYLGETFIPDLELTTQNWEDEWNIVLQLAANVNQNAAADTLFYTSLEEIHLFVLANVLKRPIIVLTEPVIRSLMGVSLQENNFAGIYLPLHWPPSSCHKSPLVLAFNLNHFTPLISMQNSYSEDMSSIHKQAVPLMNADMSSLRMHYLLHNEESQAPQILQSYLNLCDVIVKTNVIVAAKITPHMLPDEYNLVRDYFQDCELKYRSFQQLPSDLHNTSSATRSSSRDTPRQEARSIARKNTSQFKNMSAELRAAAEHSGILVTRKCIIENCQSAGSPISASMCQRCFNERTYLSSEVRKVEETTPVLNDLSMANAPFVYQNQLAQEELETLELFEKVEQCTEDLPGGVPVSHMGEQPLEPSGTPISDVFRSVSRTDVKAVSPESDIHFQPVTIASKNFYPQQTHVAQALSNSQCSIAAAQPMPIPSSYGMEDASIMARHDIPSALITLPTSIPESQEQIPSKVEHSTCSHIINHEAVAEKSCQVSVHESALCRRCNNEISLEGTPKQRETLPHSKVGFGRSTAVEGTEQFNVNSKIETATRTMYHTAKQMHDLSMSQLQRDVKPMTTPTHYKQYHNPLMQQPRPQPIPALPAAAPAPLPANTYMRMSRVTDAAECRTKDCLGYPLENPQRLCHYCYQQTMEGKTPVPNVLASGQEDINSVSRHFAKLTPVAASSPNLDLSHTSPTTSRPRVYEPFLSAGPVEESLGIRRKCANPLCQNMVSLDQELCESCIHILAEYTPPNRIVKVAHPEYTEKSHRCVRPGCKYFGSPEFGGYCSQCFAKKSVLEARENHAKSKQARQQLARPHGIIGVEPEQTVAGVQTAPRGRLCALAGCSRFGDPLFSNLCTRCYHERRELQLLETGQVRATEPQQHLQPTLNLTQNTVGSNTARTEQTGRQMSSHFPQNIPIYESLNAAPYPVVESHGFEQVMSRVEKRHKKMACKREGCANFGNSHSYGYCNSCYIALTQERLDVID